MVLIKMNSRIKIVLVVLVMIASVVLVTSPSFAQASGTVTYSPVIFSAGTTVLAEASGGNFGSGSTVYFYLSTSESSSGITGSYIGSTALPGGATTLSNTQIKFTIPSLSTGTYYIIASDSSSPTSSGAQFTAAYQVTITSLKPSISISGTQPTTSATISGSGWDPSSTVSIYLAGPQGSSIYSTFLGEFTTTTSGSIPAGSSLILPEIAGGSYTVVAQETSSSSPNAGITADSSLTIQPIISVVPFDISGVSGSQFTVNGYGFPSLADILSDGISVGTVSATNSATTASASGTFSISATLSSSITSAGLYTVSVKYNSTTYSQSNAILVSIPNPVSLGFTFTPTSVSPGSSFTAMVYNFPAGSQVLITLGSQILGQVTTDSNGFAELSGNIPAIPAGSYYAVASSSGLYDSISVTVSSYFQVLDPDGIPMISTTEYFPSYGHYYVQAFGLTPGVVYTFSDSASSNAKVLTVQVGKIVPNSAGTFEFLPAQNGTLMFSFYPGFSSSATTSSITLSYSGGSVVGSSGNTYGYTAVQPPHFNISYGTVNVIEQGASETVTVYGLIPSGSLVYPGLSTSYNIYIGSSEISFTVGSSTLQTDILSSTTTSASISFTAPSSSGLYSLAITYQNQPVSSAIYSTPIVVSTGGASLNSGYVQTVPIVTSGTVTGYYIVGYSFYPQATVKVYYYTISGLESQSESLTSGGFAFSVLLSSYPEPSGTYEIVAQATYQGSIYTTYSSYTVYPSFTISEAKGPIGESVQFAMTGFSANTNYYLYLSSYEVSSATTTNTGSFSGSFIVPVIKPGNYNVTVVQASNMNVISSTEFNVTPSNSLTILNGYYAFPGELINYSWKPSSSPSSPGGPSGGAYYSNVYVTVYFNNSAIYTAPSSFVKTPTSTYLNGSFQMPNGVPGNFWGITLEWQQYEYVYQSSSSSLTTEVISTNYTMKGGANFLGLISGSGALVTGISQSQVAEITASVNSSITTSLSIPLSELNAKISSINDTVVYLNTSFGNMRSSVTALNASIVALNGTVATLETTVGTVKTSLASLNATLKTIDGNVATVETSVGSLTGNVTSIKGNIVTIQTSLGSLQIGLNSTQKSLNSLQNKTGSIANYGLIIDVIIIVIIAITLGIATASFAGLRDLRKRFGMKKE
ncbi:MAG: hypothetical protein QW062_01880 [Thermoplasmatales archaeon]